MGQFALNLRKMRKEKGMTQDELARLIGCSRSAVGMYESGSRRPDYETLEAIADIFNVRMDDIAASTPGDKKDGNPYSTSKLTEDEAELLAIYRGLSKEGQAFILGSARGISGNPALAKKGSSIETA